MESPRRAYEVYTFDGYNEAVIGFAERFNSKAVIAYDTSLIMRILLDKGMTLDEAEEYFETQMLNTCLSDDGMPIFVTPAPYSELAKKMTDSDSGSN